MNEILMNILVPALSTLVLGLMTWLTTVVVNFLNTKIKDKKMAKIASDLYMIIMNAVQTVFQTFVDELKKEGKFDEKMAKEAKEKAYNIIVNQLTKELKEYIEENFGDIKEYIMNQIEATIYQLKNK